MNLFSPSAGGTNGGSNKNDDPIPNSNNSSSNHSNTGKSPRIFRKGLDWFQSQLRAEDGIGSPGSSKKARQKKKRPALLSIPFLTSSQSKHSIRFQDPLGEIMDTLSLQDYSELEFRNTFYDRYELKALYDKVQEIVPKLAAGELDTNRICTRGLDRMHGKRQTDCQRIRDRAINAVMDLQEEQWETGEDDFNEMARISISISKRALDMAVQEARQDTLAARVHLQDLKGSQKKWKYHTYKNPRSILKVSDSQIPPAFYLFGDAPRRRATAISPRSNRGVSPRRRGLGGSSSHSKNSRGQSPRSRGRSPKPSRIQRAKNLVGLTGSSHHATNSSVDDNSSTSRPRSKSPTKERRSRGTSRERPLSRGTSRERPSSRGTSRERPSSRGTSRERPSSRGTSRERPSRRDGGGGNRERSRSRGKYQRGGDQEPKLERRGRGTSRERRANHQPHDDDEEPQRRRGRRESNLQNDAGGNGVPPRRDRSSSREGRRRLGNSSRATRGTSQERRGSKPPPARQRSGSSYASSEDTRSFDSTASSQISNLTIDSALGSTTGDVANKAKKHPPHHRERRAALPPESPRSVGSQKSLGNSTIASVASSNSNALTPTKAPTKRPPRSSGSGMAGKPVKRLPTNSTKKQTVVPRRAQSSPEAALVGAVGMSTSSPPKKHPPRASSHITGGSSNRDTPAARRRSSSPASATKKSTTGRK